MDEVQSNLRVAKLLMLLGVVLVALVLLWGLKFRFNYVWGHAAVGAIMALLGFLLFRRGVLQENAILDGDGRNQAAIQEESN